MGGLLITLAIVMTGIKYHMTRNTNTHHDSIHVLYMIEKWYWIGLWSMGIQNMQKELKPKFWMKNQILKRKQI